VIDQVDRLIALAQLGRRMREAQREYFKKREAHALVTAKRLEADFDHAVRDILDTTTEEKLL
jgi:hypothetical protein